MVGGPCDFCVSLRPLFGFGIRTRALKFVPDDAASLPAEEFNINIVMGH